MNLIKIDMASDKNLIREYTNMYLELINLHYETAATYGIYDAECDKKTKEDAINKLLNPEIMIELLFDQAKVIGFVRYQIDHTETEHMVVNDGSIGIHIDQLYIKDAWRKMGYGTYILQSLKQKYKKISLDCYYTLDANMFYKKKGFKPVITTYLWD